ncbi:MAG: hypothetical protein CMG71_07110 [Candidatus Marinimicrobia bacterium]|nr:hypothetical protein [Candidatus Neomarinimicrobiota bacterium]
MTQVRPFCGFKYNPERINDLSSVVAPPYDVVTDHERETLAGRSPHNFIRMTLPAHSDPDSKSRTFYGEATQLWSDWRQNRIFCQDSEPGIHLLKESYDSSSGNTLTRFGFLTALSLEQESHRYVLKHEKTHTAPLKDRVRLYQHTRANLSPLFFIYRDDPIETEEFLLHFNGKETQKGVLSHRGNVSLEVASTFESEFMNEFCASFDSKHVLIADGHHRYEASRLLHNENKDSSMDSSAVLAYLVPASSEGLIVHATHRGLSDLYHFDEDEFIDALSSRFQLKESSPNSHQQFEIATETRGRFTVAPNTSSAKSLANRLETEAMAQLPVVILEEVILKEVLGMDDEAISAKTDLHYFQNKQDGIDLVARGEWNAAFFLPPISLEDLFSVTQSGGILPQKSTYFYPKVATGLVVRSMEQD